MKTKKGLSPVITTILLILLSVTAVIIIAGVIIPFVKDSLCGEKECFEASDQLTIDTENGYACNTTDINGNRVDITPTILSGYGFNLLQIRPNLNGKSLID